MGGMAEKSDELLKVSKNKAKHKIASTDALRDLDISFRKAKALT